jgi:hypothetical protein
MYDLNFLHIHFGFYRFCTSNGTAAAQFTHIRFKYEIDSLTALDKSSWPSEVISLFTILG